MARQDVSIFLKLCYEGKHYISLPYHIHKFLHIQKIYFPLQFSICMFLVIFCVSYYSRYMLVESEVHGKNVYFWVQTKYEAYYLIFDVFLFFTFHLSPKLLSAAPVQSGQI